MLPIMAKAPALMENFTGHHVEYHQPCAPYVAAPAGSLCGFFPVKPVKERSQERACQGTPRDTHKLGDKSDIAPVLDDGYDDGYGDE